MPPPSDAVLRARARALLEAMTERARWIYAVPRAHEDGGAAVEVPAAPVARPAVRALLEAEGLRCEEEGAGGRVARLVGHRERASFVVFDSAELGVVREGPGAPPILGKVLDATGFFAQSELLRRALDVQGGGGVA